MKDIKYINRGSITKILLGMLLLLPLYFSGKGTLTSDLDVKTESLVYRGCTFYLFHLQQDIEVLHSPTCTNFH